MLSPASVTTFLTEFFEGLSRPAAYFLLLLPLVLAISLVYKATKVDTGRQILRHGLRMFAAIAVVMACIAGVLLGIVRMSE